MFRFAGLASCRRRDRIRITTLLCSLYIVGTRIVREYVRWSCSRVGPELTDALDMGGFTVAGGCLIHILKIKIFFPTRSGPGPL